MDQESFDQINLDEKIVEGADLMKEGQEVEILINADSDTPLSCELPPFVELEVTYTEPGVKGDTATNTLKKATLETGAIVNVPLFVNIGEVIKIDTRDWSYTGKVK